MQYAYNPCSMAHKLTTRYWICADSGLKFNVKEINTGPWWTHQLQVPGIHATCTCNNRPVTGILSETYTVWHMSMEIYGNAAIKEVPHILIE